MGKIIVGVIWLAINILICTTMYDGWFVLCLLCVILQSCFFLEDLKEWINNE